MTVSTRYKSFVYRLHKFFLILGFLIPSASAIAQELPPIQSVQDAMTQLMLKSESQQLAALKNLKTACAGRYRRSLKDARPVLGLLKKFSNSGSVSVKKATMDVHRCFSPLSFAPLLFIQISDENPKVVIYAAEVSARVSDAAMLPALIQELKKRQVVCLKSGLPKPEIGRCVWLTYALGASVGAANEETKRVLAKLAIFQFDSPYAKVREVAVETLAATKISADAPALKALIAREKNGEFPSKNDKALIRRFEKRWKAIKKGK